MAQQLLHHLHTLSVILKNTSIGAPERVPAIPLADALLSCNGLDVVAHHFAQPKRLFATLPAGQIVVGRKDRVGRSVTRCLPVLLQRVSAEVLINGNRLL